MLANWALLLTQQAINSVPHLLNKTNKSVPFASAVTFSVQ